MGHRRIWLDRLSGPEPDRARSVFGHRCFRRAAYPEREADAGADEHADCQARDDNTYAHTQGHADADTDTEGHADTDTDTEGHIHTGTQAHAHADTKGHVEAKRRSNAFTLADRDPKAIALIRRNA